LLECVLEIIMSDVDRFPFRVPRPADDASPPRVIAFAIMGLLAGEPAVAHWREGERLECDRELAVVANGMVAASVQVAADGQLADLEGPPEVAAMTLAAALSEVTTATLDLSLAPSDLPGSCFRGSERR
jgi:hypothetical protein